jgi:poly-gamma-glutamate capsule biosynthesis protein CapA/YwtB (metallophosphatase superfamily)
VRDCVDPGADLVVGSVPTDGQPIENLDPLSRSSELAAP